MQRKTLCCTKTTRYKPLNAVEKMHRERGSSPFFSGNFDAAIFDLDGVITRTARVHAAAWKVMFDAFLQQYAVKTGTQFSPFNLEYDYRRYVDGKPRYDGVVSFLASRGITLPYGSPEDAPGSASICALGNRKNEFFLNLIEQEGVEVYESTIRLIRHLRLRGIKTAVVSSSRNCAEILDAASIEGLFDVRIDGNDIGPNALKGKPDADIFVEAARRLDVPPARAVVIEDALSGVEAGRRGNFGYVIGVDRNGQSEALLAAGADMVVADMGELDCGDDEAQAQAMPPSALQHLDSIVPPKGKQLAVFLDYDGTLTPIVSRPDLARLSEAMQATLNRLSRVCHIAVISGRDLADVQQRVGIETIFYAGSHGFDIAGPGREHVQFEQGTEYLSLLERTAEELREKLAPVEGCLVERKRFSIAVHYRQVEPSSVQQVKEAVADILHEHMQLRLSKGKKVYELQPNIDWDKGKALRWLLKALNLNRSEFIPLYIGDDVTDEDAFAAIRDEGIGILVAETAKPTEARYRLKNPDEVQRFLDALIVHLEARLE